LPTKAVSGLLDVFCASDSVDAAEMIGAERYK